MPLVGRLRGKKLRLQVPLSVKVALILRRKKCVRNIFEKEILCALACNIF
jgi:hypothetical protein